MEKVVSVISKSALQSREWTTTEGEKRTLQFIEVEMSDGIDSFMAEATDRLAARIATADIEGKSVACQCQIALRKWQSKETGREMYANSVKLVSMTGL